jgi:hypothetical protein
MPFKEEFDRSPIDVVASEYGARPYGSRSIISAQVSVLTTAKTLAELLAAVVTSVVDEDTAHTPNGVKTEFSGVLSPHPAMNLVPSTLEFTTAGDTINDDGVGNLSAAGVSGSIDYQTGEWSLIFDTAPPVGPNIAVDYDWFYVLPLNVAGLWFNPAAAVRATFSPDGVPTSSTGMKFDATTLLAAQPRLVANAKFIAGATVLMEVEVLV